MKYFLSIMTVVCGLIACGGEASPTFGSNGNCQHNVLRTDPNGWLLTEPEVHFDFWGDWSSHSRFSNLEFVAWTYLINSANVFSKLSEYGIHQGTMDPFAHYDSGPAAQSNNASHSVDGGASILDDSSFVSTLSTEISEGALPYPNDNTIYVIFLLPGVTTQKMIVHGWSGYHDHGTYGSQRFTFAIITYQYNNSTDTVVSHEIAEAATNPEHSGYWDVLSGSEIGDMCENSYDTVSGYVVQKLWSQQLCQCQ